jgi:hypothetical protein
VGGEREEELGYKIFEWARVVGMKEDGCERIGYEGENIDEYDGIFRFEGEDEGKCGWSNKSKYICIRQQSHRSMWRRERGCCFAKQPPYKTIS